MNAEELRREASEIKEEIIANREYLHAHAETGFELKETLPHVKSCLEKMGYNTLMYYTEDTYEVKDEPYFGYLRGRFTADELRELDAYAANGVTVTGNVRAWYSATRHVTPAGGTGSDFLFTPGGAVSPTFAYADDFGMDSYYRPAAYYETYETPEALPEISVTEYAGSEDGTVTLTARY